MQAGAGGHAGSLWEDLGGPPARSRAGGIRSGNGFAVKRVRLLLVTAPMEESQIPLAASLLKIGFAGLRIVAVVKLPKRKLVVLSPRQTQVLREITLGTSVKEIAHKLKISGKTVETHRQKLLERLGFRRVPELVRYGLQTGILPMSWLTQSPDCSRRRR